MLALAKTAYYAGLEIEFSPTSVYDPAPMDIHRRNHPEIDTQLLSSSGSARRKRKVVHRTAASDDKKLQASLKKLMMNNIPGMSTQVFLLSDFSSRL